MAICLAALACGGTAMAQGDTNSPPPSAGATNAAAAETAGSTNVNQLPDVTVVGQQLDVERRLILPDLGATATTFSQEQIKTISQGGNAPFNQVILRAPGVVQDSAANGDLHVRGEHANLQYRINDVLLPEGITGFGVELDPRFVDSMQLITGSLPAQYGFRTAGVVDIQTKTGEIGNGGQVEIYGGSHDTIRPSFEYGGSTNKWLYYVNGSYEYNTLGIENVTSSHEAVHDDTDQGKAFMYASYIVDDTSRISVIGSASYSTFQIPIDPAQQTTPTPGGPDWVPGGPTDSTALNDNQTEQNYYGVVSYQKSAGNLNLQTAAYGRYSSAHYVPDNIPANLNFNNGVATDENRMLTSGGIQADASYTLGDKHTIRGGVTGLYEYVGALSASTVFPVDGAGNPTGAQQTIEQNNYPHAVFYGMYLQDEWKILPRVTLNYGARFDLYSSSTDDQNQVSPRVNVVWEATDSTALHAGYSRYFTPPPLETVPPGNITAFNGTSGASPVTQDDPVRCERANYYDVGISQKLAPKWTAGVDGYYKSADEQLDDGLFGQSLILSSFNYLKGEIWGTEFTLNGTVGGFSGYANLAYSEAKGRNWSSAQFLFNPTQAAYVQNNWIYLDHDQEVTASFGISYLWHQSSGMSALFYADALYGTGLRADGNPIPGSITVANPAGTPIPNGSHVPEYYTLNMGAEQSFQVGNAKFIKVRLDVINVTDNAYELRNGTGVGVNAAHWGARIGVFGTVAFLF